MKGSIGGIKIDAGSAGSIYSFTFGDGLNGGVLTAWLLLVVGILASCCAACLFFLKKDTKIAALVALCAGVLFLVAGILYFAITGLVGGGSIGVGAVLNGIILVIAALLDCCVGTVVLLK